MQAQARPRFRHDHLIAELVEEQNNRFIDVMDPDSGNMYRFYEVEYSLACAMDGERDVAGIVKWAQDELGLQASASEVQAVISTLTGLQFVDTTAADGKAAKAAPTTPDELATGIVVGKGAAAAPAPRAPDLELGHAGPTAAASRAAEELPKADFDLGAPGAAPVKQAPARAVEDIGLGASGARAAATQAEGPSDVSIDLADHLSIKPSDVKEAVRASKVMQAVDVPKDLMEAIEPAAKAPAVEKAPAKQEPAAAAKAEAKKPTAKVEKPVEKVAASSSSSGPVEKAPEKKAEKPAEKKPVELPKQPEKKESVAPPAPSSGPNPALVIFLILVVVGAGAFFVWKYVINKPEATAPAPTSKVVPPAPAPAPPEIKAIIKVETPAPAEIKAAAAGAIESIEPADKDVKAGDTVAWHAGAKALQTEITKLTADVEKLQPAVTAAETALSAEQQKENNEAGVTRAQAKLDAAKKPLDVKKSALTQKQGELEKLALKATLDGKLVEPVKAGDKVEANGVVVKVAQAPAPTVSFKVPAGVKLPGDGTVNVQGSGAPVACKVVDAQAETIKVACPEDPSLADGASVTLVPGAK